MAPVFARNRSFDYAGRRAFEVARNIMLGTFREVGVRDDARGIEFFSAPFGSDLEQKRCLRVDRVYLLEVARVRPVPSVRTSKMLTYECEPDLEACFDFQSLRSVLSCLPFADRTALAAAAFVFFQNSELGML